MLVTWNCVLWKCRSFYVTFCVCFVGDALGFCKKTELDAIQNAGYTIYPPWNYLFTPENGWLEEIIVSFLGW